MEVRLFYDTLWSSDLRAAHGMVTDRKTDFLTFIPENHLCGRAGRHCTDYGATHNPATTKEYTKQALTLTDYCISFNFIHSLEVSTECYKVLSTF